MPNKYANKKGWKLPKKKYKASTWSSYNKALRRRGDIEIWLSDSAILNWFEAQRIYDGV